MPDKIQGYKWCTFHKPNKHDNQECIKQKSLQHNTTLVNNSEKQSKRHVISIVINPQRPKPLVNIYQSDKSLTFGFIDSASTVSLVKKRMYE